MIRITITEDAKTTVAVNGVSGQSCKGLTAKLEKALGKTVKDKKTAEFYQRETNQQRLKQ